MKTGIIANYRSYDIDQQLVIALNAIAFALAFFTIAGMFYLGMNMLSFVFWVVVMLFSLTCAILAYTAEYYDVILRLSVYVYALILIPLGFVSVGSITMPTAIYSNVAFFSLNFVASKMQRIIINPFLIIFVFLFMLYEYYHPGIAAVMPHGSQLIKYYLVFIPIGQLTFAAVGIAMTRSYRRKHNELVAKNSELQYLMRVDTLTGLYNKQYLNEQLKISLSMAVRKRIPLSVLLIDIDFFKMYNDTYGHLQGDECLKEIAGALKDSALRDSDIVFRFGGEEFVVLLNNTQKKAAIKVAERILFNIDKLDIEHKSSSIAPRVTVSIGVSSYDGYEELQSERLVLEADKALYKAKNLGRNRYYTAD